MCLVTHRKRSDWAVPGFTRISFKVVKLLRAWEEKAKAVLGKEGSGNSPLVFKCVFFKKVGSWACSQDNANQLTTNLSHRANLPIFSDGQSANEYVFKTKWGTEMLIQQGWSLKTWAQSAYCHLGRPLSSGPGVLSVLSSNTWSYHGIVAPIEPKHREAELSSWHVECHSPPRHRRNAREMSSQTGVLRKSD